MHDTTHVKKHLHLTPNFVSKFKIEYKLYSPSNNSKIFKNKHYNTL